MGKTLTTPLKNSWYGAKEERLVNKKLKPTGYTNSIQLIHSLLYAI